MARTVAVVQAGLPEWQTRQRIEHRAERAARKHSHRQTNHALEHQGVVALLRVADFADRPDARDVGRAAEVLAAGVDQQQAVAFDLRKGLGGGAVVRHGAIGVITGDGGKGQSNKAFALGALSAQPFIDRQFAELLATG